MSGQHTVSPPGAPQVEVQPALELDIVHAGYGPVQVLHGISMSVAKGALLAILGPNGAGKSTTVRTISGLIRPVAGQIRIDGVDITGVPPAGLATAGLCVVPEGRGVFPRLTVDEHIRLLAPKRGDLSNVRDRVFTQFPNLKERRHQVVGTMSGGEQQMVAMSRAVALPHQVVVIDELSMGLAPRIVDQLYEHVADLAASGVTVVVIEQFIHEVLELADDCLVLNQGRVVASGPPKDVSQGLEDLYLSEHHNHEGQKA